MKRTRKLVSVLVIAILLIGIAIVYYLMTGTITNQKYKNEVLDELPKFFERARENRSVDLPNYMDYEFITYSNRLESTVSISDEETNVYSHTNVITYRNTGSTMSVSYPDKEPIISELGIISESDYYQQYVSTFLLDFNLDFSQAEYYCEISKPLWQKRTYAYFVFPEEMILKTSHFDETFQFNKIKVKIFINEIETMDMFNSLFITGYDINNNKDIQTGINAYNKANIGS